MVDFTRLAGQGRAYSALRAWTPEEFEAVLKLETECDVNRTAAADFVRNGITTPEAFRKAREADFVPKTLNEAAQEAEAALKDNDFAAEVAPAEVVPEPTPEVAPEVAPAEEEVAPAEEVPAEEVAPAEESDAPVAKKGKK